MAMGDVGEARPSWDCLLGGGVIGLNYLADATLALD